MSPIQPIPAGRLRYYLHITQAQSIPLLLLPPIRIPYREIDIKLLVEPLG